MNSDIEDKELNKNMQLLNLELRNLIDDEDDAPSLVKQPVSAANSCARGVLREMNCNLDDLISDGNAPEFEFHGYGCIEAMSVAKKKTKVDNRTRGQVQMAPHKNTKEQQKENIWDQKECADVLQIHEVGNSSVNTDVEHLLELFRSLHEQISSDLPSNQPNSLPSDYFFELFRKCSMPMGCNIRHHVQVLCTKASRFISRLRRQLELNRHFDYMKYTECDTALNEASQSLLHLKEFTTIELRHRSMEFISPVARNNAANMELVLKKLSEQLKTAHIYVHVFNWEMDLEHRYSTAMRERHEATKKKALDVVAHELLPRSDPLALSDEEKYIAEHYNLDNVLLRAKKHEEFLNMLIKSPESYFPPEIIAMCDPPKQDENLSMHVNDTSQSLDQFLMGDIIDMPPSSPPKRSSRIRLSRCN